MKFLCLILLSLVISVNIYSRELGETEITADDGIEVFQDEKYYILKKNVKILADNFTLLGDLIKISFIKDLYDIQLIDAKGNVEFNSKTHNLKATGTSMIFILEDQEILIEGINSVLITQNSEMFSNGKINVNNLDNTFIIKGPKSSLKNDNIVIKGRYIDGKFSANSEINQLTVEDENIAYVDTNNTEMYANKINYNKTNSLIELEKNVRIISKGEEITGDYATINMNNNSYKIKSKDSKKVKVIISNNNE